MKKVMIGIMFAMLVLTVSSVTAYSDDEVARCKEVLNDHYSTSENSAQGDSSGVLSAISVDANSDYENKKRSIQISAADTGNTASGDELTVNVPSNIDDKQQNKLRRRALAAQENGLFANCDGCRAEARPATTADDRTEITRTDRVRFFGFELDAVSTVEIGTDDKVISRGSNFAQYLFEHGLAKKVN